MGRFAMLNYQNEVGSWVRLDFIFYDQRDLLMRKRLSPHRTSIALLRHDSYTNRDMILSPSSRM